MLKLCYISVTKMNSEVIHTVTQDLLHSSLWCNHDSTSWWQGDDQVSSCSTSSNCLLLCPTSILLSWKVLSEVFGQTFQEMPKAWTFSMVRLVNTHEEWQRTEKLQQESRAWKIPFEEVVCKDVSHTICALEDSNFAKTFPS